MGEEQTVKTEAEVAQSTRISDIYAAAKRLEGIVRKTPLVYSEFFSDIAPKIDAVAAGAAQRTAGDGIGQRDFARHFLPYDVFVHIAQHG